MSAQVNPPTSSLPVCVLPPPKAAPIALPPHLLQETDCAKLLDGYLKCVESHTKGLQKDDECDIEKLAYKACTARQRRK